MPSQRRRKKFRLKLRGVRIRRYALCFLFGYTAYLPLDSRTLTPRLRFKLPVSPTLDLEYSGSHRNYEFSREFHGKHTV
ncbi:hypothetical protein M422DRAFT_34322 [Sphaerobolus stellatus SS14]|uniref:Uncharacterized protein n=1 Tax=Sphaerobolus stellatus (strain SS14) TaxID=990650 RepID=A0A0C9V3P6_SPHS4|nr:hypothetical protein M422DRAFT_34322 [Sphaerobolus stellatus SS14]